MFGTDLARKPGRPKGSTNNPNRKPLPFRQKEVERLLRAARRQKLNITGCTVDPKTGLITVMTGEPGTDAGVAAKPNPWDK